MPTHVYWMLEVSVPPGRSNDFRALMEEMVKGTQAEPGALNYEWSATADGATWHIFERYADSAATMVHLKNFGEKYAARFMGLCKPTRFIVCGTPSQEVKNAMAPSGAVFVPPVGGFSR